MAMPELNVSNLWWLRTDNPNVGSEAIAGLRLGAQIAQNRIESERQINQDQLHTSLRLMDLMLDGQRNDLAVRAFQAKQMDDLASQRGIVELTELLARSSAQSDGFVKPENEKSFWEIAARNPKIPREQINQMYDNTFGKAKDFKARSEGIGKESTAGILNTAFLVAAKEAVSKSISEYDEAVGSGDPEAISKAEQKALKAISDKSISFRTVGVVDPEEGPQVKTSMTPEGKRFSYIESPRGGIQKILPDESKIVNALKLARYQSGLRALENKTEKGLWFLDPRARTNGKFDPAKAQSLAEEDAKRLWEEAGGGDESVPPKPATPQEGSAPRNGVIPMFDYNPTNKTLTPIVK